MLNILSSWINLGLVQAKVMFYDNQLLLFTKGVCRISYWVISRKSIERLHIDHKPTISNIAVHYPNQQGQWTRQGI